MFGKVWTLDDLYKEVEKDKVYYIKSKGGVTASGGEPTLQPEFVIEFFKRCKENGISTALDTCGITSQNIYEKILPYVDLLLLDIKEINPENHQKWTGVSNEAILDNARRLAGRNVEVRVPLVPGITDTESNLLGIFEFMKDAGLERVAVLPYNTSAGAKYEWLGTVCEIEGETQSPEALGAIVAMGREAGLNVVIG